MRAVPATRSIVSTGVPGLAASKMLIWPVTPTEIGWLKAIVSRVSRLSPEALEAGVTAVETRVGERTAIEATVLVTLAPAELLTTTVYSPALAPLAEAMVKEELVAPMIGDPLRYHWKVGGGEPAAETERV